MMADDNHITPDPTRKPKPGDDDYVGKNHAPKKNQFQKGQSGNPGGRPKKRPMHPIEERQVFRDFFEAGNRSTRMRDGKKIVTKPAMVAVYDQLFAKALLGEPWAVRRVIDMRIALIREYNEDQMAYADFCIKTRKYIEETGKPLPEDVLFTWLEYQRRVERHGDELFDGPEELAAYMRKLRGED